MPDIFNILSYIDFMIHPMKDSTPQTVWIIAGPTASGKSALAAQLGHLIDGAVINADSMQIYQEIPIISAQPSPLEKEGVPHLLYGFVPVTENYSAPDWADKAIAAIATAAAQNKQPILVGGSGLYFKALTEGFSPMPQVPATLRKHVCDLYDMLGPAGFHTALKKIDPEIADRLHPTDRQRCIRAREVFEASGEPLSAWQAKPKQKPAPHLEFKSIILTPDRAWLHERINTRFVHMVENGALEEAHYINAMNLAYETTGLRAVGLQALRDYLDRRITLVEAIELGQTQSRQYAKRQYTWFRNQSLPNAHYINHIDDMTPQYALEFLQN